MDNMAQALSFVADGLQLSGVLHLPARKPLAVVVGCHGLMADKHSPKQIALAKRCTAIGMAYFRFDHRGCGESDGAFELDTTLENRRSDLMAAVHALHRSLGENMPIGLFGSSLGGTVCLTAAGSLRPFAIVTLAAPVQGRSIQLPEHSPTSLKEELFQNRMIFDITAAIEGIHHILIIHGSSDETVALENTHRIYNLARDPKKRLILKHGDHRISRKAHQDRFLREAAQWFLDCCNDQLAVASPQTHD